MIRKIQRMNNKQKHDKNTKINSKIQRKNTIKTQMNQDLIIKIFKKKKFNHIFKNTKYDTN